MNILIKKSFRKITCILSVGIFILFTAFSSYAAQTYEYYPSGNVKSITYDPAENGVEYEEFLDEEISGWGYNWVYNYFKGYSSRLYK